MMIGRCCNKSVCIVGVELAHGVEVVLGLQWAHCPGNPVALNNIFESEVVDVPLRLDSLLELVVFFIF